MSPGRAEPSTSFPARPCAAPPRPARGMSGFWIRQVFKDSMQLFHKHILFFQTNFYAPNKHIFKYILGGYLSSPKPGHTTGGSGRGARRGGRAGSGRTGCQQNCSHRGQASLAPANASKKRLLDVSPEARTSEISFKPMEEQSPRLTTGSSPVYPRFISGTRSACGNWLFPFLSA